MSPAAFIKDTQQRFLPTTNYGKETSDSFMQGFQTFYQQQRQLAVDKLGFEATRQKMDQDKLLFPLEKRKMEASTKGMELDTTRKQYELDEQLDMMENPRYKPNGGMGGYEKALDGLGIRPQASNDKIYDTIEETSPNRSTVALSSYTPGKGDPKMEGGPLDRHGNPAYTMEQFKEGKAPYVTVAMDPKSPWQGKELRSPKFPGISFKVMDTGGAFKGNGLSRMDIAFSDPARAYSYDVKEADFEVI